MQPTKDPSELEPRAPYGRPYLGDVESRDVVTDDVAAAVRRARWRLLLLAVGYLLAFVVGAPLLIGLIGPWGVLAVLVVCVFCVGRWADAIWVCPRCAQPLGRSLTPSRCGHCGQALRR